MGFESFYKRFDVDERVANVAGFNPYYMEIDSGLNEKIWMNGRQIINLASNNYLGLATDERVKEAIISAVEKYGASLCGTPISTGYVDLYKRLEYSLSNFVRLEDTIILPSCYQGNNGLFVSIAKKEDLIIVDRFAHSSLIQGIKAVGCKIRPFLHNNLEHLEGILKRSQDYKQIFVVTESVFSTDGDISPFKEIIDLCEKYNALPIIDDSHGIGVLGNTGKGILEEENIINFKGIYTASLGKALANSGGMISGKKEIINYLKYYCPHLVYSTSLTPSILAGIEAVLKIVSSEFESLKNKLYSNKQILFASLMEAGFETTECIAPINSIKTQSKENTFKTAKSFFEKGILSTPFIEPSVPVNQGCIRLIAGANLTQSTIEEACEIIKSVRKT